MQKGLTAKLGKGRKGRGIFIRGRTFITHKVVMSQTRKEPRVIKKKKGGNDMHAKKKEECILPSSGRKSGRDGSQGEHLVRPC